MKIAILFCVCVFSVSIGALGWAEVIKLRSGQTVEAKILKKEKDHILVEADVGLPITYFLDEVKEILPDRSNAEEARVRADAWERQALELIDKGRMEEGLKLIRQAMEIDPDPLRRVNYASVLFGNGVSLFKSGRKKESLDTLRLCEEQLRKAIAGFDSKKQAIALSQAYFLLGEIYAHALSDPGQAKEFYRQALVFFDHAGAKSALARL